MDKLNALQLWIWLKNYPVDSQKICMVAERTQVRSCSPASSCRLIFPPPARALRSSAMAAFEGFEGFIPGFGEYLHRLEKEGQIEALAMVLGLVGVVRAVARAGRHFAEKAYHRYLSFNDVEVNQEEVFAQVDWQAVQQSESQSTSPSAQSPESAGANQSVGSFGRFAEKKKAAATTTTTTTITGKVQGQVQRVEARQPMKLVNSSDDDDNDDSQTQRQQTDDRVLEKDQIERMNEQNLHEAIVASRNLGKGNTKTDTDDPLQHAWVPDSVSELERLRMEIKTKDSRNAQLEQEMRRMQRVIDQLDAQPTPVRANIATPQTPLGPKRTQFANSVTIHETPTTTIGVLMDFNTINAIKDVPKFKGTNIVNGCITRPIHSPTTDTSSEDGGMGGGINGLFNLGSKPKI